MYFKYTFENNVAWMDANVGAEAERHGDLDKVRLQSLAASTVLGSFFYLPDFQACFAILLASPQLVMSYTSTAVMNMKFSFML